MPVEYIKPPGMNIARAAERAYGYAVRAGNLLFISGQVGRDHAGEMVGIGDPEKQTIQAMENMKEVVEAAGGTMADVISTRTFLSDRAHLPAITAVRKRYFTGPNYPTGAMVVGTGLSSPEYLVEIEAVAYIER
jgi:enamine deaminase RidA (YjgF/YER057c/UK114 family)